MPPDTKPQNVGSNIMTQTAKEKMDRYEIPKEYSDCVKSIEDKTQKNISNYLSSAILREVTENTSKDNPDIYANKFMEELKGKSFYFIKSVMNGMLIEAEMYCELKD